MTTATFEKSIRYDRETRDYAMYLDGELIGFARTNHEADVALGHAIYDRLIHGDCNTAEEMDAGQCGGFGCVDGCIDCIATQAVVPNDGIHLIQYTVVLSQPGETFWSTVKTFCDACRAKTPGTSKMGEVINGFCDTCGIGPSVSHFMLTNDPPGDDPLGDTEGDPVPPPEPAFPQRSYTRADKQIEQTMQRNRQCSNCGDAHYGWQCPEIGDAVTAIAVYDTDELVRLWGASRALLVTKLARLTEPQLLCQAMDFAAWLNKRTQANLAARSVLVIWEQMINEHWRRSPVVAA